MEQLCWKCGKCYKPDECPWLKAFIYPDGAVVNKKGYIRSCPLFEKEIINKSPKAKEIAEFFEISVRSYYRNKIYWILLYNRYKTMKRSYNEDKNIKPQ